MINFSTETKEKLLCYQNLLILWQNKMNLVSNNSLNDIWQRHILDSIQLSEYIKGYNKKIIDIGSGAGFPGLVLAINDKNNYYFLVDSISKKCIFLNEVKNILKLDNVEIINNRIENIDKYIKYDYITSRALANLEKLLKFSDSLLNKKGTGLFLKGKSYLDEIEKIKNKKYYNKFTLNILNSKIDTYGKVIIINRI